MKYLKHLFFVSFFLVVLINLGIKELDFLRIYLGFSTVILGILTLYFNKNITNRKNTNHTKSNEAWYIVSLILISTVFLIIKIGMPLTYTGSYIGEYYNILAGVELFEKGELATFYDAGTPYNRGLFVSFFVGLFTSIFGKTIFVAKMVPALVGVLSFLLLFLISNTIFKNKITIIATLITYTFAPFVIFNHFFIRFYSFYELFLLLKIWLFLKIYDSAKKNKAKTFTILTAILICFEMFVYITSNDTGRYLLLITSFVFFTFLFFTKKNFFKNKFFNFLNLNFKWKFPILIILSAITFLLFDGINKINFLLEAKPAHPADLEYGFSYLFFNIYYPYTLLFLASVISTLFFLKNKYHKLISILSITIFILFMISSEEIQLIRVMLLFLSLFFLNIFLFIDNMQKISKPIYYAIIVAILILIPQTYPKDFLEKPYLPGESPYTEFKDAFDYIKEEKADATNIAVISSIPSLSDFYNVKMDYFLNETGYKNSFLTEEKIIFGDIPIIGNLDQIDTNACVIIRKPSSELHIDSNYRKFIEKNWSVTKNDFYGISVFCNY